MRTFYENPAGEVGIHENVLASDLEEEAGMSDESYGQFAAAGGNRLTGNSGTPGQGGAAHQGTELLCLAADCDS